MRTNNALHRLAVEEAQRLFPCTAFRWHRQGFLAEVMGQWSLVYVRVARAGMKVQHAPSGRSYPYRLWFWNLHAHTVKPARPWCWVLIGLDGRKRAQLWMVPGQAMARRGKTLGLTIGRRRPGTHWLEQYAVRR